MMETIKCGICGSSYNVDGFNYRYQIKLGVKYESHWHHNEILDVCPNCNKFIIKWIRDKKIESGIMTKEEADEEYGGLLD